MNVITVLIGRTMLVRAILECRESVVDYKEGHPIVEAVIEAHIDEEARDVENVHIDGAGRLGHPKNGIVIDF